ncbi:unnamed protein product [Bathycoccus prasinos]
MGNAVGAKNHRDFVIFLLLETFAMIVSLLVAVIRVWEENPSEKRRSKTGVLFFVACDVAVLIPVLLLVSSQVAQVARNITTNELMNLHRYTYLRATDGTFKNPFDKGVFKNLVSFFCVDANRRTREFEEKANNNVDFVPYTKREIQERVQLEYREMAKTLYGEEEEYAAPFAAPRRR